MDILWEYVYLCDGIERMAALYVERRGIGTRNKQCTVFINIISTRAQEVQDYQPLATCHDDGHGSELQR